MISERNNHYTGCDRTHWPHEIKSKKYLKTIGRRPSCKEIPIAAIKGTMPIFKRALEYKFKS